MFICYITRVHNPLAYATHSVHDCWTRDPGATQAGIRPTPFLYGYKHTPLGFGFSFVQQGTHTISLDRNYRQPNIPLSRSSCSFETILPTGRG
ncbi:hypothetical protein HanXRQr2_Chr05g0194451 [Helianthus annuus]|uniref:Uncharacterized protein n=1 Tax=Helianthus annuus TaxID=4232 RepID=A0A251UNL9_HELAN|nr:hypothetical protein HanXRQr2_Chr05g0194451 [Helianthus annuus]